MDLRRLCLFSWSNGHDFGEFNYWCGGGRGGAGYRRVAARQVRKRVKRAVVREIETEAAQSAADDARDREDAWYDALMAMGS